MYSVTVRFLVVLFLLSLLVFPVQLNAQAKVAYVLYDQPFESGLRATGMGGAWLAAGNEPMVVNGNPALAASIRDAVASVNVDLTRLDQETQYYFSATTHYAPGEFRPRTAAFLYPFELGTRNISVGLSWERVTHMQSPLLEVEYYDKGFPYYVSGSMAVELNKAASFGATVQYLGGSYEMSIIETTPEHPYGTGHTILYRRTFEGLAFRLGYSVDLAEAGIPVPLTLGFMLRPGFTYDENYEIPGNPEQTYETEMPWVTGFGLAWRPLHNLMVGFDIERHMYRGTERRFDSPFYGAVRMSLTEHDKDINGYRLGVEYTMQRGGLRIQPRLGLNYLPSYYASYTLRNTDTDLEDVDPAHSFGQSIGLGLTVGVVQLDLAYERATMGFTQKQMHVPYRGAMSTSEYNGTSEQFMAGVSYRF